MCWQKAVRRNKEIQFKNRIYHFGLRVARTGNIDQERERERNNARKIVGIFRTLAW